MNILFGDVDGTDPELSILDDVGTHDDPEPCGFGLEMNDIDVIGRS